MEQNSLIIYDDNDDRFTMIQILPLSSIIRIIIELLSHFRNFQFSFSTLTSSSNSIPNPFWANVSNNRQFYAQRRFFIVSSFEFELNENKGSWRDRNGWAGKVNEGRARLNSSSRILVASGFDCRPLESIPYLFANRYAEFPIPKLIFASSNFDTYQHSGCAVLLHELQRQR